MASLSKAKILAKRYGGTWKYDGCTTWWCDDGKRHVTRTSSGVDEWENALGPPDYILYNPPEKPIYLDWWHSPLNLLGV
jgi:hypothetical protein